MSSTASLCVSLTRYARNNSLRKVNIQAHDKLSFVDLGENSISSLSPSVFRTETILLDNNLLTDLPTEYPDVYFKYSLSLVDLSNNQLTRIPSEFGSLLGRASLFVSVISLSQCVYSLLPCSTDMLIIINSLLFLKSFIN